MAMVSKAKNPEVVMNPASAEHYKKYGNTFVEEGHTEIGYRYDHITILQNFPRTSRWLGRVKSRFPICCYS